MGIKNILMLGFMVAWIYACKNHDEKVTNTTEKAEELKFPEDYYGNYKGTLSIVTSNGEQFIPMEFTLAKGADTVSHKYSIFYGKERSERAYNLVETHDPNLFLVDENNGIVLESAYTGNMLSSIYEVQGNLLQTTELFYKDRMEWLTTMARVQDTSQTGSREVAEVTNYPISIIQKATLYKQ